MVALYVLCVTLVAVTNNVGRWQNVGENDWDNALWTTCMQDMGWRKQPADLEAMVLQRMLILKQLEPYRHKTLDEVIRLFEKGLLDEKLVKLKINFNALVDRFERENINIIEFASKKPLRDKINIITNKLLEYVTEDGLTTATEPQS